MPVPRLFEAFSDPAEQWVHVLGTILQMCGPETRQALVAELVGDPMIQGTDAMLVREQRAFGSGDDATVVDLVLRNGSSWSIGIVAGLGFGVDRAARIAAAQAAVAGSGVERPILVVITSDRRPPAEVEAAAAGGAEVVHKSWLRVRDWVQERPERGQATGVDLAVLREAEYYFTPRVAELYRAEGLFPMVRPELRDTFATLFFDLNELAPAPTVLNPTDSTAVVNFPRTGETLVTVKLGEGDPVVQVAGDEAVIVASPEAYVAARSSVVTGAKRVLPPRK
ncbi:MAG: hypothetical protein U0237_09325 [Thermoleophilia bacterium]